MAAIYMWPVDEQMLLTTTLYPVEVEERLYLGATISDGYMSLVPAAAIEGSPNLNNGSYTQLRWFYSDGPYDDAVTGDPDLNNGSYTQLRWFYEDGPYIDAVQGSPDLPFASLENKLVEADTPDESLQVGCVVQNISTMTVV